LLLIAAILGIRKPIGPDRAEAWWRTLRLNVLFLVALVAAMFVVGGSGRAFVGFVVGSLLALA
jgi:hypothetical protein